MSAYSDEFETKLATEDAIYWAYVVDARLESLSAQIDKLRKKLDASGLTEEGTELFDISVKVGVIRTANGHVKVDIGRVKSLLPGDPLKTS